jgi:hypothetical protein
MMMRRVGSEVQFIFFDTDPIHRIEIERGSHIRVLATLRAKG